MVPDIGPSRCVAIECKTIDPRINLSEPKTEHTFQAIVQLGHVPPCYQIQAGLRRHHLHQCELLR